jgi:phytoene dehydrogenase-like protein
MWSSSVVATTVLFAPPIWIAGLKVLVLDQRPVAGGAAVTEEFSPGFRNSIASYAVSLLNPKIIRELDLAVHGLRIVDRPVSNFLPLGTGSFLKVGGRPLD